MYARAGEIHSPVVLETVLPASSSHPAGKPRANRGQTVSITETKTHSFPLPAWDVEGFFVVPPLGFEPRLDRF